MPKPQLQFSLLRAALALPLVLLAACGGPPIGDEDPDSTNSTSSTSTRPGDRGSCLQTHDGNCLTNSELAEQARQLTNAIRTATHRRVPGSSNNWARDQVNAYEAYANLLIVKGGRAASAPGQGVHIGFVDSGIHTEHPDFSSVGAGSREIIVIDSEDESFFTDSHGTAVASAAVGLTSGIAWGANITMFSSRNTKNPDFSDFVPLDEKFYRTVLDRKWNLDILNQSLGASGLRIEDVHESAVRTSGRGIISLWAQPSVSEKTIMVWAAGNDHCDYNLPHPDCDQGRGHSEFDASSPQIGAGLAYFIPELRGHWVAVAATDRSGMIANFSNRCGIAAQ